MGGRSQQSIDIKASAEEEIPCIGSCRDSKSPRKIITAESQKNPAGRQARAGQKRIVDRDRGQGME